MRFPTEKSEAVFFGFTTFVLLDSVFVFGENALEKVENPFPPFQNILCAEPRAVSICIWVSGISFTNRLFGLAL